MSPPPPPCLCPRRSIPVLRLGPDTRYEEVRCCELPHCFPSPPPWVNATHPTGNMYNVMRTSFPPSRMRPRIPRAFDGPALLPSPPARTAHVRWLSRVALVSRGRLRAQIIDRLPSSPLPCAPSRPHCGCGGCRVRTINRRLPYPPPPPPPVVRWPWTRRARTGRAWRASTGRWTCTTCRRAGRSPRTRGGLKHCPDSGAAAYKLPADLRAQGLRTQPAWAISISPVGFFFEICRRSGAAKVQELRSVVSGRVGCI